MAIWLFYSTCAPYFWLYCVSTKLKSGNEDWKEDDSLSPCLKPFLNIIIFHVLPSFKQRVRDHAFSVLSWLLKIKIGCTKFSEMDYLPVILIMNLTNTYDIANMLRIQDFCSYDIKEIKSEVVKVLNSHREWKCEWTMWGNAGL